MHPIHYSLLFNAATLGLLGWLAYVFAQPLLVVIGLLIAQHSLGRFAPEGAEDDDDDSRPIGFTAPL